VATVGAAMVVTSVGFQALSQNPLVPDATLNATDAPEDYNLSQPGTVGMVAVEHRAGHPIPLSNVSVLLGSRSQGMWFFANGNWTAVSVLRHGLYLNGEPIRDTDEFGPGDRLTITKMAGTRPFNQSYTVRVRVFHNPSDITILDQRVRVR